MMVFSRYVDEGTKSEIMSLWGGSNTQQFEKYLGFPQLWGDPKKRTLMKSKQSFGKDFKYGKDLKYGKKSFYLKEVKRSYSKLWP